MKKSLYLRDNQDFFLDLTKEDIGYKFYSVKSIEDAVSAIASEHFHLCIVDHQNGADFVCRVRLEQKWNAPIIFIAKYPIALSKVHLEAFAAGKIQFIEKPYELEKISKSIQEFLYVDFDRIFDALEIARKELLGNDMPLPQFALKALKSELDYLWEQTYEVEGRYFKRLVMKLKTAVNNLLTEGKLTMEQLNIFEQGVAILKDGEITEEKFYSFTDLWAEAGIDTMVRPKTEFSVDRLLEMYEMAMTDFQKLNGAAFTKADRHIME